MARAPQWAWLAPAVVLWFAATAAWRPLMLPDEGRYVGVALEMLRSGDWLVPTLDGLPYLHKPPLFYWITAATLSLGGVQPLAARAAPLLGACAMVLWVAWFAGRWLSARWAAWAPWVLATMPMTYLAAQYANLDMLVAACITGAVLLLADALLRDSDDRGSRGLVVWGWAVMALGVLAKGLIGVVLPLATIALWLLARPGARSGARAALRRLLPWQGLVLFAALALPWFAAVQLRHDAFLHYFFVYHHFERFSVGGFNNVMPFWFFLPVLAVLSLPWCALLWPTRSLDGEAAAVRALRTLLWLWLAVIVGFFSVPSSKLVGYVLPALPPVALLITGNVARRIERSGSRARWLQALLLAAALLCVAGVAWVERRDRDRGNAVLARALDAQAAAGAAVYALDTQPYDLNLHQHAARPLRLVSNWADPSIATVDNWRKELADAARFAPSVAAQVLLTPEAARAQWCAQPVSWIVAGLDAGAREAVLRDLAPLSRTRTLALWRLDRAQLDRVQACR